ncbi:hypothetical protein NMY22_g5978 [Coprinellus aureogranulatus]|nr:hypothetical protein NMY22_g5978 [Coprinellus aureogranulatus]
MLSVATFTLHAFSAITRLLGSCALFSTPFIRRKENGKGATAKVGEETPGEDEDEDDEEDEEASFCEGSASCRQ